jgi:transcriptional regulator with XRE-family HTH domain
MNQSVSIAERLRSERTRLGLSQPEFGDIAGVTKKTQLLYESGERNPDSLYLSAIATGGADVLFILTGRRSQSLPPSATLPRDQQALIHSYEMCSGTAKKTLLQTAALLAAGVAPGAAPAPQGNMTQRGNGNVQVGHAGGKVSVKKNR